MDFDGPGFGPWGGGWWHALTFAIGGFIWLLGIALLLAVLFFLIRFLLVATKAAQLYVNQHAPAEPVRPAPAATTAPAAGAPTAATTAPAASAATTATTPAPATGPTTPLTAATKPATKPRTPRKPTT
jgi:predicted lipid-binding transport protein (Tim44 family)